MDLSLARIRWLGGDADSEERPGDVALDRRRPERPRALAAEGDRARAAGCDGFIAKPCLPHDLVEQMTSFLRVQTIPRNESAARAAGGAEESRASARFSHSAADPEGTPRAPGRGSCRHASDVRGVPAKLVRSPRSGYGPQALEIARARRPAVLVTDLSLPGIDGFELIARMREDPAMRTVPVVCFSGYGGEVHEERARAAGCDRIIQKPCLPDTVGRRHR